MAGQGFPSLPNALPFREEALRRIAQVVNGILGGKTNNASSVTLTVSVATTTIQKQEFGPNTHYSFTPLTANAAAEIGNGTMYVSSRGKGTMTITHANNAQADRSFSYSYTG
jgi:hypothetical protein